MTIGRNTPSLFPESDFVSGILTDDEISDAIERGFLITNKTFNANCLEASSYDVRIGSKGIIGGEGIEIDLKKDVLELSPGSYGGIISLECFKLPSNVCGRIGSKRALSYDGIILLTGAIVDPGYEGHLLFGIYNASQKKVLIRVGRKLCTIVFERLSKSPAKQAPINPNLLNGNFPDEFLDKIANMDVLPWMQISDRVKQIEQITKDILDLRSRYEDVLQPIKDLTASVKNLTNDVSALTNQTKSIASDVESITKDVQENNKQINQLTANMNVFGMQLQTTQSSVKDQSKDVGELDKKFGAFKLLVYIFWGILLIVVGALLPVLFNKIFGK